MACPAIITGDVFLLRVLTHIDCQAQVIGSYGYQALGQPGSPAAAVASTLLTLFVALFGLRLLFGPLPGLRDTVYDVLKIGIVLTLAFSWPAFRTVIYDVVVDGPAELASVISGPADDQGKAFLTRLQEVDAGIVQLIDTGTGRNSGVTIDGGSVGANFAGTSLQDDAAFGWSRLLFLGGTIGTVGLLRLLAGLLLAIAPLMAALLLFEATRGIFAGWLRGLVLVTLGTMGATVVMGVQLALIEPWLVDAFKVRALGYATPSTPIELFAITLGFGIVQLAMLWLLGKVAFYRGWPTIPRIELSEPIAQSRLPLVALGGAREDYAISRARRISDSVETMIQREEQSEMRRLSWRGQDRDTGRAETGSAGGARVATDRLGDSFRRTQQRGSFASRIRDTQ